MNRRAFLTALGGSLLAVPLALGIVPLASAQDNASAAKVSETVQRGKVLYESKQYEAAIDVLKPVAKNNYRSFALPLASQGDTYFQYFLGDAKQAV